MIFTALATGRASGRASDPVAWSASSNSASTLSS
jgi:hypothetical protein